MSDIEIVVFKDKAWVRLIEYQKLKDRYEALEETKEYQNDAICMLQKQIERMKCCGNCFHNNKPSDTEFCWNCERQLDERPIIKDEWEITE